MFKPYPYSPGSGKTLAFSFALQQLLREQKFRKDHSYPSALLQSARGLPVGKLSVLSQAISAINFNPAKFAIHG